MPAPSGWRAVAQSSLIALQFVVFAIGFYIKPPHFMKRYSILLKVFAYLFLAASMTFAWAFIINLGMILVNLFRV